MRLPSSEAVVNVWRCPSCYQRREQTSLPASRTSTASPGSQPPVATRGGGWHATCSGASVARVVVDQAQRSAVEALEGRTAHLGGGRLVPFSDALPRAVGWRRLHIRGASSSAARSRWSGGRSQAGHLARVRC